MSAKQSAKAKERAARGEAALDALDKLRGQLPWAFDDKGALKTDELVAALRGMDVASGRGARYRFDWAGSQDAFNALRAPVASTLAPRRDLSVDFDNTRNIFISGDNLEVLKVLRRAYAGRVKMIYIDPPYNTGNDFVYKDNFRDPLNQYLRETGQADAKGKANRAAARKEERRVNGHKHSNWMSMMLPRLFLAREFLSDDGVIFISIDDNEVHHLRILMNIVFGEENFVAPIAWQGMDTVKNDARHFSTNAEFILACAKNLDSLKIRGVRKTEKQRRTYKNRDNDPRGDYLLTPLHAKSGTESAVYEFTFPNGQTWRPPEGRYPAYSKSTLQRLVDEGRVYLDPKGRATPQKKTYWNEANGRMRPTTFWRHEDFGSTRQANAELRELMGRGIFDNPKPVKLVKAIADLVTEEDDLVMDFFAGSATTAHAIMALNAEDGGRRQCLSVQLPEPTLEKSPAHNAGFRMIADIGMERLRRAGAKIQSEGNGNMLAAEVDTGFRVFELAESAFRPWRGIEKDTLESYTKEQQSALELLPDELQRESLLVELMLEEGYPLASKVEELQVGDNTVWRIMHADSDLAEAGMVLHICLDPKLEDALHIRLDLRQGARFIARDRAVDDSQAVTLGIHCRIRTI